MLLIKPFVWLCSRCRCGFAKLPIVTKTEQDQPDLSGRILYSTSVVAGFIGHLSDIVNSYLTYLAFLQLDVAEVME